jgi:hypothetical protein
VAGGSMMREDGAYIFFERLEYFRMSLPKVLLSLAFAVMVGFGIAGQAQAQGGPAGPAPSGREANIPPAPDLEILIKGTLIVFNAANITGDYGTLHKLGSPQFQRQVSEARLVEVFKPFREQGIEVGGILLHKINFTEEPRITERGWLRLVGAFETRPNRVNFRLQFDRVDERWRLVDIYVHVLPASGENK